MEFGTQRRLIAGFISNWISKFAGSVIQLVQVPVFLHFWNVPLYGEWIVITSIPTYLNFSNIGFGSVAANEMTMLMSSGDRDGALRVFQSCWWLIVAVSLAIAGLLGSVVFFLPVARELHLTSIGTTDVKWILIYLGCSVLLGQLEQLLQSAYTSVGRYAYGTFIKSVFSLLAFAVMMVPVVLGYGPRETALAFAVANATGTIVLSALVRKDAPWIDYGWRHARFAEIRRLFVPAVAFMGFPMGNALNLQGTLLVVGRALGPANLVAFGTARTVSRIALQMVQMVNITFWPELSLAYGAKNDALIRVLHRHACQLALIIVTVFVILVMIFGQWFMIHWTGGRVPASRGLLAIFLVIVILNSLWSTSSTLIVAINQHRKLAAYYVASAAVTIILTFIFARYYGLFGAAISLVVPEILMNFYVVSKSLRISNDKFESFVVSLFEFPPFLRRGSLLRWPKKPHLGWKAKGANVTPQRD